MPEPSHPLTRAILALSLPDRLRLAARLLEQGARDLVPPMLEGVCVALVREDLEALLAASPDGDPLRLGQIDDFDEDDDQADEISH